MLTDATPRKANRRGFLESDRIKTLGLPQNGHFQEMACHLKCGERTLYAALAE